MQQLPMLSVVPRVQFKDRQSILVALITSHLSRFHRWSPQSLWANKPHITVGWTTVDWWPRYTRDLLGNTNTLVVAVNKRAHEKHAIATSHEQIQKQEQQYMNSLTCFAFFGYLIIESYWIHKEFKLTIHGAQSVEIVIPFWNEELGDLLRTATAVCLLGWRLPKEWHRENSGFTHGLIVNIFKFISWKHKHHHKFSIKQSEMIIEKNMLSKDPKPFACGEVLRRRTLRAESARAVPGHSSHPWNLVNHFLGVAKK